MMFLDPQELIELTGRHRRETQKQALRFLGIEHRVRADGKILVLRAHVERQFGESEAAQKPEENKIRWDLLNA
jgi:hypothetical protein